MLGVADDFGTLQETWRAWVRSWGQHLLKTSVARCFTCAPKMSPVSSVHSSAFSSVLVRSDFNFLFDSSKLPVFSLPELGLLEINSN